MKNTKSLFALTATFVAALAATVNAGTILDPGTNVAFDTGIAGGATYTTSGWTNLGDGLNLSGNTTNSISFGNIPTGFLVELTVRAVDAGATTGNPTTWNGVTGDIANFATFTGVGGSLVSTIEQSNITNGEFELNPANVAGSLIFSARSVDNAGTTLTDGGISAGEDWGTLVYTGINSLTYNSGTSAGNDAFTFQAQLVSAVPEPTSAALLGFAGLGLLARRKRA